jgi:hypothetical protein
MMERPLCEIDAYREIQPIPAAQQAAPTSSHMSIAVPTDLAAGIFGLTVVPVGRMIPLPPHYRGRIVVRRHYKVAYIAPSLALIFVVLLFATNKRRAKLKQSCIEAFKRIYSVSAPPPSFSMSYHYGFPSFEVTFRTKVQWEEAAQLGLNSSFSKAIESLCKPKRPRFDVQRAIFFTYIGHIEELLAARATKPK